MKIHELYEVRNRMVILSHLKDLVQIAYSDGTFEHSELQMIFSIGLNAGLNLDDLKKVVLGQCITTFTPPGQIIERIEQLYDMVLVMMANGIIDKKELSLCKYFAEKLGFLPEIIDKILDELINDISKGIEPEMAFARCIDIAS